MGRKQAYRDFCLAILTHLTEPELFDEIKRGKKKVSKTAKQRLEEKIAWGKKIINEKTRLGDLVLLEHPHEVTRAQYQAIHKGTIYERAWGPMVRRAVNFYGELADYALKQGRKVGTLEPTWKTGTRVSRWSVTAPQTTENIIRDEYFFSSLRNLVFHRLIKRLKPALAITAGSHGNYLAGKIRPAEIVAFEERDLNRRKHKQAVQNTERNIETYRLLKLERLENARLSLKRGRRRQPKR